MEHHTGKNIRTFRLTKQIDIEALAQLIQMDVDYLTKVENETLEPAVSDLLKIANAMGTDIATLIYGVEERQQKVVVTRPDNRLRVNRHNDFVYESLAPYYTNKHIEPFTLEIKRGEPETAEFSKHIGEEFHYILSGTVRLQAEKEDYILREGDSIYFDSSLPHALTAVTDSVKILSAIYNGETMLQLTQSKYMRDLILAAKHMGGRSIAVVCGHDTELEAINKAIEEGVIKTAYLVGDTTHLPQELLIHRKCYEFVHMPHDTPNYHSGAAATAVALVRDSTCQMLMKGQINTALFVKAILDKEVGITTGRRLSLVSIFELPKIDRLIFLTDPGINPGLFSDSNVQSSIDIVRNGIDVAKGLGVVRPKVALLEANEVPSDKIPSTVHEQELSKMQWDDADVYGPLSYDIALYEEASAKKGFSQNPVAGKADILVVPYISGGNFLYKAWAMTMNAEVASIVVGATAPVIITSRNDNDKTKFLTICASTVYSQYLADRNKH
ncbi:MAG: cupin domain-containing protein [Chitinivibrionales bacterium]|nr:cupin domain-containing protein [Chitinivibrionales bacterium]